MGEGVWGEGYLSNDSQRFSHPSHEHEYIQMTSLLQYSNLKEIDICIFYRRLSPRILYSFEKVVCIHESHVTTKHV